MVFIVVFAIIAIIVLSLNFKDNANLEKIEDHFKAKNCQNIIYSKGSYKGICGDILMEIDNGFEVDLKEDKKTIKLKDIKKVDDKVLTIIINDDFEIEFKDKQNKENFYNNLKEKLNK